MPKPASTTTAIERSAPSPRPTPSTTFAKPATVIANVVASPITIAERPPPAAGRAGGQQRGEDGEDAGRDRGAGAGHEREQEEQRHALTVRTALTD